MKKIFKVFKSILFWGMLTVLLAILALLRTFGFFDEGQKTIVSRSTLQNAVKVAELSTAQYTYNGIAEVYRDESHKKVKCRILYNSTVKAGINFEDVDFDVDNDNKIVTAILPAVKILANTVTEDELSFIPSNSKIDLPEALSACKEDAEREAKESAALMESAEKNAKSAVEAIVLPFLEQDGYQLVWEEK